MTLHNLESNTKNIVHQRMTHYLESYSLKRILNLTNEIREELRETSHVVQTLIYDTYGKVVSLFMSLCSKTSPDPLLRTEDCLKSVSLVTQDLGVNDRDIFQPIEPLLAESSKLERKQALINFLLKCARLPPDMQRDIEQGNILSSIHRYRVFKRFLERQGNEEYFHRLLRQSETLFNQSLETLFCALSQANSSLDVSPPPLIRLFPSFMSFSQGVEYLVISRKYSLDILMGQWTGCSIKLLCDFLHHYASERRQSDPCLSSFEDLLNFCCEKTFPSFLSSIDVCLSFFPPESSSDEIKRKLIVDGVRTIFNVLLSEALKQDFTHKLFQTIQHKLTLTLSPIIEMKPITQAYDEFLQSLTILLLKNMLGTIMCPWFHNDFIPMLEQSKSLAFRVGDIDNILYPTKEQLDILLRESHKVAEALGLCLQRCIKDWKTLLDSFSLTSNEWWSRMRCEICYILPSIVDLLQKVVTYLFNDTKLSSERQGNGPSTIRISPFAPLSAHAVSYSSIAYNHIIGLHVVVFLERFQSCELCKVQEICAEVFETQEEPKSCSIKQECMRLCHFTLQEVTERWGRELTYLLKSIMQPVYSSRRQLLSGLTPDEIQYDGASFLIYETMRVTRTCTYLFDNQEALRKRHAGSTLARLEGDILPHDLLDAKKLVTSQDSLVNISSLSDDVNIVFSLLSSTVSQGVLEIIRHDVLHLLPCSLSKCLQFYLIILRDFLRRPIRRDSCSPLGSYHSRSSLTLPSCDEDKFVLSDTCVEHAIFWLVTHSLVDQGASAVLLYGAELEDQLIGLKRECLELLNNA